MLQLRPKVDGRSLSSELDQSSWSLPALYSVGIIGRKEILADPSIYLELLIGTLEEVHQTNSKERS